MFKFLKALFSPRRLDIIEVVDAPGPTMEIKSTPPDRVTVPQIRGYQPLAGVHDELLSPDGIVRPHWQKWLEAFGRLSEADISSQVERLNQTIHDSGLAYDLFADPTEREQSWSIDMAPLIIAPEDWAWLETALQ